MNKKDIFEQMLPTVHQLLRLYLTIPVTSSTAERTFSALKGVLTYVHSTMTEMSLNNCLLLHIHKDLTEFNSLMRSQNVYGNRHTPSKDISHNFAILEHLRFICSGGLYDQDQQAANHLVMTR